MARAAVSGAAAAACLTLATPAWASSTIPLHPDHTNDFASEFQPQQCGDENFADLPDGYDGWHFVLPTNKAGDFLSLTLKFKNGAETVTVNVPDASDTIPDFLSNNGEDGQVKHAYVFTPAGWQLVGGSAEISGEGDKFNLSHTCAGDGDTPGTPTPTTPVPTTPGDPGGSENPSTPGGSGTPTPGTGGGGGDGEDDGSLPITGVAGTSIALTGLALIGGGVALTVLRRRRDKVTFTS
ncbi:LPXTG cell wall anchor domain-containing protein [Micromonospora sp. H33]|uniref:LPXTG cell wall anchor domain-containing protein n=1 Tax=Micromonospora sp. H33 TaxID=3452215 RepID=UPI003F89A868